MKKEPIEPSALLICQYGQPVRGLSPYGDALLEALAATPDVSVIPVDYLAPYPGVLHPAAQGGVAGMGQLHWGRPASWRRVARTSADIVHIQHWLAPMASYLAPLAHMARRAGKRIVVTVHNPATHETLRWTSPFERWLFAQSDALVVHDAAGAFELRERFGLAADRIRIIPHGINPGGEPALPDAVDYARLELNPQRRYVCVFGNLRGYKGIEVLLAAWSQVAARVPDVDLVIAGRLWAGNTGLGSRLIAGLIRTDRDAKRIRGALDAPELMGRVYLREGFQPDADIDALLRVSDFAVFPYVRFASQSGAACRAAGMGCPVMVSNIGGLPDLAIDRSWIVEPGDVAALSAALLDRLGFSELPSSRRRQIDRVECYAWSNVAASHAGLYRDLV